MFFLFVPIDKVDAIDTCIWLPQRVYCSTPQVPSKVQRCKIAPPMDTIDCNMNVDCYHLNNSTPTESRRNLSDFNSDRKFNRKYSLESKWNWKWQLFESRLQIFPFIFSIKDKHLIGFDLIKTVLIHFIILIHLMTIGIHFRRYCDARCCCQHQWIGCRRDWWWGLSWRIQRYWLCCWYWSCWNWFSCCWTICVWNNVPITRILIKPAEDCTEIEWLFRWRIHRKF